MESAHRVEVGGERIGVSGLQLLDKALDVGGNDVFGSLPLLRLFEVFADGGNGAVGVHGCFLLGFWLLHVRVETRHVHAERHLAKAGVARRKGRGLPTGAKRRRPKAGPAQAKRGRLGKPLVAARSGQSPLSARSVNRF